MKSTYSTKIDPSLNRVEQNKEVTNYLYALLQLGTNTHKIQVFIQFPMPQTKLGILQKISLALFVILYIITCSDFYVSKIIKKKLFNKCLYTYLCYMYVYLK